MTKEHRDYVLIKELYHCTPSELDEQDETVLQLHFKMLQEEKRHEYIEQKRTEQKTKMQALSNKKQSMADSTQYNLSLVIKAQNEATKEIEKIN